MTPKFFFLCDGKACVYVTCHFSQLSSPFQALLNTDLEPETNNLPPYLTAFWRYRAVAIPPTSAVQLLPKGELILLSFNLLTILPWRFMMMNRKRMAYKPATTLAAISAACIRISRPAVDSHSSPRRSEPSVYNTGSSLLVEPINRPV